MYEPEDIIRHLSEKDKERFWNSVDKKGPDECWEWKGRKSDGRSHGQFNMTCYRDDGSALARIAPSATRVAWLLSGLKLPKFVMVRPSCKTLGCCNPKHLETCTMSELRRGKVSRPIKLKETQPQSPLPTKTIERIKNLLDPTTVDALLDCFQSDGMPMGSDRWAEYCHARLRELIAKERTLDRVKAALNQATHALEYCASSLYRDQRKRLTEDHQRRSKEREDAAFKKLNGDD